MTKYQLVPYLVHVNVRGKPKESRPLDDLDAGGKLDLATELAGILAAHAGKTFVKPSKAGSRPVRLKVVHVGKSTRMMNFTCAPGHSGVESVTVKADGTGTLERGFNDVDFIEHRHLLAYRPGAHWAILLAERIGGDGVITSLRRLFTDLWSERHEDLVLTIAPAADEQAWQSVLVKAPVVKYLIKRASTTDGRLSVSKKEAEFELTVRPPGRGGRYSLAPLSKAAKEQGKSLKEIMLQEVTPVLAPGIETPEDGAEALMEQAWSVAVQLDLDSGQKPTVNVESDASVTFTFPVIDGQEEPPSRPSDNDILAAVKRLVKQGVYSNNGWKSEHAATLQWTAEPWQDSGDTPWEVRWDVDQLGEAPSSDAGEAPSS